MQKKTIFQLLLLFFIQFFFANNIFATDLILTNSLNGAYYSPENILTSGDCYVAQGATATLSTNKTVTLNPGFHVTLGGTLSIDNSDTDGDGLPDSWEEAQYTDISLYGPNDDPDGDLISLYWECLLGLGGNNVEFDTDNDGMPDWYEVATYENLDHDESDGDCDCE